MPRLERVAAYRNIFGNGIEATTSPGVDPDWRYNPNTNNYDFIGKPAEINSAIAPSEQPAGHKVPEIKAVALIK